MKLGGFNVEGQGEAGTRFFIEQPTGTRRGKFEEYRDIPEGAFLEGLHLRIFLPDESYSTEFGGSKWGQEKLNANPDMWKEREVSQGLEREKLCWGPIAVEVDDDGRIFRRKQWGFLAPVASNPHR